MACISRTTVIGAEKYTLAAFQKCVTCILGKY